MGQGGTSPKHPVVALHIFGMANIWKKMLLTQRGRWGNPFHQKAFSQPRPPRRLPARMKSNWNHQCVRSCTLASLSAMLVALKQISTGSFVSERINPFFSVFLKHLELFERYISQEAQLYPFPSKSPRAETKPYISSAVSPSFVEVHQICSCYLHHGIAM